MKSTSMNKLKLISISIFILIFSVNVLAQDDSEKLPDPDYVTVRVFEARVPTGKFDMTDQLFKLRTASQTSDEGWINNLRKAYPNVEFYLLKTGHFRLFKSPKKGIIEIGNPNEAHSEIQVMTAHSIGDGTTPGTSLIVEVNDYGGAKAQTPMPAAAATHGIEAEQGMTYFFTNQAMKVELPVYTKYLHDDYTSPTLEKTDHFYVASISYEKSKHLGFMSNPKEDAALIASATRKADIQIAPELKGIWGKVIVRAEVTAEGKLKSANIWSSTAPELNSAALAAARQYEFSPQKEALVNIPIIFAIDPPAAKGTKTVAPKKKVVPAVTPKKAVKK